MEMLITKNWKFPPVINKSKNSYKEEEQLIMVDLFLIMYFNIVIIILESRKNSS